MVRQFREKKRVSKYLDREYKAYLGKIGALVFQESQATVPVSSGRLKDSGEFKMTTYGWNIEYSAPYASDVHNGTRSTQLNPNPWVGNVREHQRNATKKLHTVREHRRTQKMNVKPIKISGLGWRNVDVTKPISANPWIERAFQKIKGKQPKEMQKLLPKSIVRGTRNGY